ncbi:MAG: hypothetical protein A2073_00455 [Deltaproteobacteria bacterium GWC2_42_11]|nr:MAG: hypothetical protein A2073_00455 [Deltaproteobacteria bacterium GWC2_42_11]HBO84438.1 hypothetical protein [Deltaproteobacteria bacterium]
MKQGLEVSRQSAESRVGSAHQKRKVYVSVGITHPTTGNCKLGTRVLSLMLFLLITHHSSLITASYAAVTDKIVAVVNDSIITLSDLNAAASIRLDELRKIGKLPEKKKIMEAKSIILDQLIERKLVEQSANKAGITVSEREIDNAIDDVKKQNNIAQDMLLKVLTANGITFKEYRNQLKDQIRQVKFVNKEFRSKATISDEDIETYYKQNMDRFYEPLTFRIRQIFLALPKGITSLQKQEIEKKAREILVNIRNGEDFSKLALSYSQGPNPENGGDIGHIKAGEMDPILEKIALSLKVGGTSDVIQTTAGLHIMQVTERKEQHPKPLEAVKAEINNILFQKIADERYRLWVEEQKSISYIEVML